MKAHWLCAALLALALPAAPAAYAQSEESLALARQLVARSGLAEQLKGYPRQIDAEIAQARGRIPEALLASMREAAQLTYDPAELRGDIARTLAAGMAPEDMKQAIAWLESPPGRRVTLAEEESSASMTPESLQAFLADQTRQAPQGERAELIAQLLAATRAVEHAVFLAESIALGVAVGMDAAQPEQNRIGAAKLRERLRSVLPTDRLRETFSRSLPLVFAYMYRNVSEKDLRAYAEFNRSALGTRYNDKVTGALTDALTRASIAMGPIITRSMQKKAA